MTDEQKVKIISMRIEGLSFSEISKVLKLSVNTVKSFYRRSGGITAESPNLHQCRFCAKSIVQPTGTREKKFCSDKCRMAWWNSHRDDVNKKAIYTFKCECCGREFQAYGNNHRKFCGRTCYIKSRFGGRLQ